ncbi:MAG: polymer-forming cytoskeletal protein [Clostridium sp.]
MVVSEMIKIQNGRVLNLSGSSECKFQGGEYESIRVSGSSDLTGNYTSNEIIITGSCDIEGDLKAGTLRISGSSDIVGDIEVDSLHRTGSCDISGNVRANIIKSSGSGDITGYVEVDRLQISGSGDIIGNVNADYISISGSSNIDGNVVCNFIELANSSDINGSLSAKTINLKGNCDINGEVTGEELTISGNVTLNESCEVAYFKSYGAVEITRHLYAEEVDIRIGGDCEIGEIGAGKVTIKRVEIKDMIKKNGIFSKIINNFKITEKFLRADVIEGDDIFLENTIARIVRGKNIVIGVNCEIENIEYI